MAIDDTGAGYSSLRHVIELTPDFLKLDRELVRDLGTDKNRRALVSAMVAFASEVGTSVIAEGVETETELDILCDAEVHLVQGYLLARPGPAWPTVDTGDPSGSVRPAPSGTGRGAPTPDEKLSDALDRAPDPRRACAVVVEHLFRQGQVMPSVYLERRGELRCIAQRGLWQILDGMCGWSGITGRTWMTGQPDRGPRRLAEPRLPRGHPRGGLRDLCPDQDRGARRSAPSTSSPSSRCPPACWSSSSAAAAMLGDRLQAIGDTWRSRRGTGRSRPPWPSPGSPTNRTCRSVWCDACKDASQMDSAALVLSTVGGHSVAAAAGPLAEDLFNLTPADLDALSSLVGEIRSCYTGSRRPRPGIRRDRFPARRRGQGGGRAPALGPTDPGGQRGPGPLPARCS